jgi:hypothetical protein
MRRNNRVLSALLCILWVMGAAAASRPDAEDDGRARRPPAARAGDAGAGADESMRRPALGCERLMQNVCMPSCGRTTKGHPQAPA